MGIQFLVHQTLADLGWSVNDELEWVDNQDGTFLLKKKEERDE